MTSRPSYQRLRSRAGRLRDRLVGPGEPDPDLSMLDPGSDPGEPERAAGRAPEVELEPTNLGPVMDEAVLRAKQRLRIGVDRDYDLLYENFDVLHYLLQAPHLIDDPDVDVIEHFLERGRAEKLSPHPDFSMAEYLKRYPQKLAPGKVRNPYLFWLKYGRKSGDVADPTPGVDRVAPVLGLTPDELVETMAERRRDLQERFRTGRLGEMLARAAEIEPLIGATWTEIADPHLIPLSKQVVVDETCALYEAQQAAEFRRARIVFVINRPRWGSGRRMEGHLAHALSGHVDSSDIVVIYTDDTGKTPEGRFPDGVREIDFATMSRGLPRDRAQRALVMLLRTFHADAIINVNSRLLYRAMRLHGHALAVSERLFLCLFCNEQTALGSWTGWGLSYFYRTFEHVTGVITDSHHLADELVRAHRVTDADRGRLHVLHAPVPSDLPVVADPPPRQGRPQVFWAGRFDRQKRIPLVLEIARAMPDVDFRLWGEAVLTGGLAGAIPDNIRLEGVYEHISDLALADADVWLYTSAWDGVPSQLLEVAMTGIPIVGSLVGGTGEVLTTDDAWPIPAVEGASAYVAAIRDVLADPLAARRRAASLRERMLRERTESAFAAQAVALLLPAEDAAEQAAEEATEEATR